MKSTSKKSSGLLGGFDFQPIFEVQRLIEQGDVSGALAEAGLTKKKIPMPESHQGVASCVASAV